MGLPSRKRWRCGKYREQTVKKFASIVGACALLVLLVFVLWIWSRPERGTTGQVSTKFRWLGPSDRIVVDGFDDPKVQCVACHISRAVTGGVKGELGFAANGSRSGRHGFPWAHPLHAPYG
jgi:CreA protein